MELYLVRDVKNKKEFYRYINKKGLALAQAAQRSCSALSPEGVEAR